MLVSLEGVEYRYATDNILFPKPIDLTIAAGKIYGLLGPNGSGKTTLIKIICGLVKAHRGNLHRFGTVNQFNSPEILQQIFFVPEGVQLPDFTPRTLKKSLGVFYPTFSSETYTQCLNKFSIESDKSILQMSYGQRRKTFIAFALSTGCKLIILDEPTNGLDIDAQMILRKLIVSTLSPESSFIVSTHHVQEFESLIDHLVFIKNGTILCNSSLDDLTLKNGQKSIEAHYLEQMC